LSAGGEGWHELCDGIFLQGVQQHRQNVDFEKTRTIRSN